MEGFDSARDIAINIVDWLNELIIDVDDPDSLEVFRSGTSVVATIDGHGFTITVQEEGRDA